MLKKVWDVKLTRFLSVGVFNTLFDLSILNTLVFVFKTPILIANLISASISMTTSYFLNHHIVFRHKENHSFSRFAHFFAVTGRGILCIQTLVIFVVTHLLSPHEAGLTHLLRSLGFRHVTGRALDLNVAKLMAVLIAMTWNFLLYHFVIFRKPDQNFDDDILL
jgi:putative flippase GtrA